jgi:HK97 family phage major capsid protein
MAGSNVNSSDDFIRRQETELRQQQNFANEIIARAQVAERDLNDDEKNLLSETRGHISRIKGQLDLVEDVSRESFEATQRERQVGDAIASRKGQSHRAPVEYRSAGQWMLDSYKAHLGDRECRDRLEMFYREAAHQTTADNLGVVPDPIVGDVINFIDAARPLVSAVGPRPMPSSTWHRPRVTQSTKVAAQGSAGAAGDEKKELSSQKMTITRLNATAVTYGGYVNVSRQDIDFSQPSILDIIINDLAAQYAIETEAAFGAALATTNTNHIDYTVDSAGVAAALWDAAAAAYTAVRGQGRLILAVAPDVLSVFGPLFAPINPVSAQSTGFTANGFSQGVVGNISGISTVMSSGLGAGTAYVFSTAAIECYEQRVGTLQVTEPSVLGVQVAYAGYFTPLVIEDDAIIPLALGSGS